MGLGSSSAADMTGPEAQFVQKTVSENCVVIFSKTTCPYCSDAKRIFEKLGTSFVTIELNHRDDGSVLLDVLGNMTNARTVSTVNARTVSAI
jgi:glutaredoxin 3